MANDFGGVESVNQDSVMRRISRLFVSKNELMRTNLESKDLALRIASENFRELEGDVEDVIIFKER